MLKLGTIDINGLYKSITPIVKAFKGNTLVFQVDKSKPYYCEVEYLESSTTSARISTGVVIDSLPVSAEIVASTSGTYNGTFQTLVGTTNKSYQYLIGLTSGNAQFAVKYNNATLQSGVFAVVDTKYKLKGVLNNDNLTLYVDDGEYTLSRNITANGEEIGLFAQDYNTLTNRIYYCKIWQGDSLVRDFIPVLDWDMTPCMYDKVSKKLYYNEGTGEFTYGRQIHYVEYLATTGTQYIDTNIKTSSIWNIGAECADTTTLRNLIGAGGYGGQYVGSANNGKWALGPSMTIDVSSTKLTDLTIEFNFESAGSEAIITADGQSLSRFSNYSALTSFKLWATQGGAIQGFIGKTYYAKCTDDNGKIVRDYLPAIDEKGVGFMFDRATHTIFDNVGVSNFGYPPVELLTLEADGNQYIDTLYTPQIGDEIEIDNLLIPKNAYWHAPFSAGTGTYQLILLGSADTFYYKYFATGGAQNFTVTYTKYFRTPTSLRITKDGELYLNNTLVITSPPTGDVDTTLDLFQRANDTSRFIGQCGAIRIIRNGNIILNFIPYIDENRVVCLYEKVSKTYFYNAGTGSFTIGSIAEKR